MTIIAYKNGVIAADTHVWFNGYRMGGQLKIACTAGGYLIGVAGNMALAQKYLNNAAEGLPMEDWPPPGRDNDGDPLATVMTVSPKHEVRLHTPDGIEYYGVRHAFATGRDANMAMAAMEAGATAVEAIRIVMRLTEAAVGPIAYIAPQTGSAEVKTWRENP